MKTFRLFTTLALTFLTFAPMAVAQTPEKITVDLPFEFTVANKTLPAGNYTIKSLTPTRLLIRSEDGQEAVIASVFAVQAKQRAAEARLVFLRYGDQHFLYQTFVSGAETGRQLSPPRLEVRVAKALAPVQVTINGR